MGTQVETGTPYMLFKDACNSKSNQKNLGTIKSSNLCTEIIEYTDPDEVRCSAVQCSAFLSRFPARESHKSKFAFCSAVDVFSFCVMDALQLPSPLQQEYKTQR